jgi:hypothetical protein
MSDRNRNCGCKKCTLEEKDSDKNLYSKIIIESRNEYEFTNVNTLTYPSDCGENGKIQEKNCYDKEEKQEKHQEKETSMFVWSSLKQQINDICRFQYVTFENPPIGPINSAWTIYTQPNYAYPTNFISQISGWYNITYNIHIYSGKCSSDCASVLTLNGTEITGSMNFNKINEYCSNSNTVLVNLTKGDSIALLFWSNEQFSEIGNQCIKTGILPSGIRPKETSASIIFTRIIS